MQLPGCRRAFTAVSFICFEVLIALVNSSASCWIRSIKFRRSSSASALALKVFSFSSATSCRKTIMACSFLATNSGIFSISSFRRSISAWNISFSRSALRSKVKFSSSSPVALRIWLFTSSVLAASWDAKALFFSCSASNSLVNLSISSVFSTSTTAAECTDCRRCSGGLSETCEYHDFNISLRRSRSTFKDSSVLRGCPVTERRSPMGRHSRASVRSKGKAAPSLADALTPQYGICTRASSHFSFNLSTLGGQVDNSSLKRAETNCSCRTACSS
mmetsp:Transcript_30002/g.64687  ORF Transcript_30002/g.64687 Transcript_30002/m.64687 type:complete len:275 (-) Transcript_30002:330-1154(-)